jgi:type VI secretion system protein ImpH
MDSPSRTSGRNLSAELKAKTPRYGFFQAVRLLALTQPGVNGHASVPRGLRFRTPATLAFPASEISELTPRDARADETEPLQMQVNFMGLTGPSGALPTHYTELLIERKQFHRDVTAHAFFDLFSHRAISLFYSAWRKYRFYVPFEQGEREGFTRNLLDLSGVGLARTQERLHAEAPGVSPLFFAYFSGLLAQKPLSASAITAFVSGHFQVPVTLEQFVGQWIAVPENEQTRLTKQANQLGVSTFAGQRAWDQQTKMRLRIGPLNHARFTDFLPGKPAAEALEQLLKFCLGNDLACETQLVLRKEDIPPPIVKRDQTGLRLGQNIWLATRPFKQDADQMAYMLLH